MYKRQDMCLPGYWERNGLKNFDGVVWFRRSLEIPAEWIGKPLKLNLGMIDALKKTLFYKDYSQTYGIRDRCLALLIATVRAL